MTTGEKIRIFLFGVFELLVWQKKFKNKNNVCCRMTVYSLSGVRLTNPTNRVPL